jgi:hypothetical protein
MVQQYQLINQEVQKEISSVIEKDTTLNADVTQLRNSDCGCENENTTRLWNFPFLCMLLFALFWIGVGFLLLFNTEVFLDLITYFSSTVGCFWFPAQEPYDIPQMT